MDEKIIESIVKKVVKEILEYQNIGKTSINRNKTILIGADENLLYYLKKTGDDIDYISKTIIEDEDKDTDIIICSLSIEDMTALSLGLNASFGSPILNILSGKKVSILSSGMKSRQNIKRCSRYLKTLIHNYEQILSKIGYEIIEKDQICKKIDDTKLKNGDFSEKKLITEKNILSISKDIKTITIKNDTLITPLAKDLLKDRNILIKKL